MSNLAPSEIQTGGAGDALYGGAVRVRRGRKRRTGGMPTTALGKRVGKKPEIYDPSEEPKVVVPSAKASRTYTLVKTVMGLMFARDGGEYKIPADTFKVENATETNCTKKLKAWASAVKLNFSAPTNETVENLGTAQHAFAECMYNAIILAKGLGSPDQNDLAEILAKAETNEAVEMIDNQISFIMSLNVGVLAAKASDEETVMMGGGEEDFGMDDDEGEEDFDQTGGMRPHAMKVNGSAGAPPARAPAAASAGAGAASAAAPAAGVPQDVLVQVAGAPSLAGQLAIAQQAQNPPAGGAGAAVIIAEAPSSSYELARAAFRLFLSPFRSCYRTLPQADTITRRLNETAEAVENRRDILPTAVVVSTAAAGLLMPGLAGGALTGAANTLDAVNAVLPSGLSILSGAAGNAAAVGSLAMSAGRLGATAASVYVASRAVGALTNTGARCAVGATQLAVLGVGAAGSAVSGAIEGAPEAAVGLLPYAASAAAPALAAAPGAVMSAAAGAPGAAVSAGRRVGGAVQSAFAGIRGGGGGGGGEHVEQLALANAAAVEAVMDAPDEASAMAAATSGAAAVRSAISAAGGSGAYAVSAGNAIESRLKVLAGKKRGRAQAEAEALAVPAGAGAGAEEVAGAPPANRPRTEGGCPTCGSHGGGSRKKRKSKAKKSRKQKKRTSYRRKNKSKSHSPSEEIYASPPAPVAITLPRMESSGPPVRS